MISKILANECTGCCACMNVCPHDSIQMQADDEGFIHPVVDLNTCTNCGLCLKKCPINSAPKVPENTFSEPHATWSLDEHMRFMSTSGGAFSEIASSVISKSGVVVGARYTENHLVEHYIVDSIKGLEILRQSKYIQSTIGMVFRDVADKLKNGVPVAFCGTPCQTAGLVSYLGGKPENLLLIDFICRGVNSPKAYIKYLEMLERKYSSPVTRVWFKNKTHGWNRFSTRVDFENGKRYIKDRYTDLFMRGYIEFTLYMRPSCYNCKFKGRTRLSDLTLADFWGGGNIDKSFDPDKGTSLVVAHTQKGRNVLESVRDRLFVSDVLDERVYAGNKCTDAPPAKNPNRDAFLKSLDTMTFDECMKKYAKIRKSVIKTGTIYVSMVLRKIKNKQFSKKR